MAQIRLLFGKSKKMKDYMNLAFICRFGVGIGSATLLLMIFGG